MTARRVALALAACLATAALPARAGIEEGRTKAQVCLACHGPGGNSTQAGVPSISAQPKQFIVAALYQYRAGKRSNPLMSPMAANLSNADFNDLAAFFSAEPATAAGPPSSKAEAGHKLAVDNNCVACHAANLMGQQHIPRLAGQRAEYLRDQLKAFKTSARIDMDGTMASSAQVLSNEDIDVLADYLGGLAPKP
jgi:cytochrome c553